jgi:DNA-binding CsgD family transcriptional regulator
MEVLLGPQGVTAQLTNKIFLKTLVFPASVFRALGRPDNCADICTSSVGQFSKTTSQSALSKGFLLRVGVANSPKIYLLGENLLYLRCFNGSSRIRSREASHMATENPGGLGPREQQIAALLLQGCSNTEIAKQLKIKPRTVKANLNRLFERFGITDGIKRVKLATLLYRRAIGAEQVARQDDTGKDGLPRKASTSPPASLSHLAKAQLAPVAVSTDLKFPMKSPFAVARSRKEGGDRKDDVSHVIATISA